MKLYEINEAIMSCLDAETGEIVDCEALESLMMQREEKLENVALWIKNLTADAAAYKAEKESFAEREKAATKRAESLKHYLVYALNGQKFTTAKCVVSFRKSEKVEIIDETILPKDYVTETITIKPDKTAIKNAIKSGQEIKGAQIVENLNISIK